MFTTVLGRGEANLIFPFSEFEAHSLATVFPGKELGATVGLPFLSTSWRNELDHAHH